VLNNTFSPYPQTLTSDEQNVQHSNYQNQEKLRQEILQQQQHQLKCPPVNKNVAVNNYQKQIMNTNFTGFTNVIVSPCSEDHISKYGMDKEKSMYSSGFGGEEMFVVEERQINQYPSPCLLPFLMMEQTSNGQVQGNQNQNNNNVGGNGNIVNVPVGQQQQQNQPLQGALVNIQQQYQQQQQIHQPQQEQIHQPQQQEQIQQPQQQQIHQPQQQIHQPQQQQIHQPQQQHIHQLALPPPINNIIQSVTSPTTQYIRHLSQRIPPPPSYTPSGSGSSPATHPSNRIFIPPPPVHPPPPISPLISPNSISPQIVAQSQLPNFTSSVISESLINELPTSTPSFHSFITIPPPHPTLSQTYSGSNCMLDSTMSSFSSVSTNAYPLKKLAHTYAGPSNHLSLRMQILTQPTFTNNQVEKYKYKEPSIQFKKEFEDTMDKFHENKLKIPNIFEKNDHFNPTKNLRKRIFKLNSTVPDLPNDHIVPRWGGQTISIIPSSKPDVIPNQLDRSNTNSIITSNLSLTNCTQVFNSTLTMSSIEREDLNNTYDKQFEMEFEDEKDSFRDSLLVLGTVHAKADNIMDGAMNEMAEGYFEQDDSPPESPK
jgi:hypothetical protein